MPWYGRPVDDHDEPDDSALLANVGVKIAVEAEELVTLLNRAQGYSSRRRALATCRTIGRLAEALADELASVDPAGRNGR